MPARTWPQRPDFADDSERLAWEALVTWLRDDDVLLHGVRFTDIEYGDVEIDLLVLMPEAGAVAIEVKGGHVTYANGGFRQSGISGAHPIDPVGQARRGAHALRRFLENQPTWSRGRVRATWLACFPYTEVTGAMGPEGRADVLVGASDLPGLAQRAYDRLRDPSLQSPLPVRGWVDSALDHLLGTTSEAAETRARSVARLEHVDALTHDQAALLTFAAPNRRYEISGSAGTGKTWLAMEQARRWAEDGERVCFVSYGRGVAEYVRRATSDFRRPLSFVGTFHQLGFTWGVQAGTDADAAFWEEEAPRLMLPAAAALPDSDRFTAFVVDEAQDFADAWWPALLRSGTPDYRLAVLRDDEQAVFTSRRGRPEVPLTPFALRENLRNPVQVVDTFRPLIAAAVDARGGDGFPVEFRPCEADDVIAAADEAVESLLDDHGWLPEDIAVLTTAHRHPVQLESAGDKSAYWDDFFGPGVFYSTVAGFKGLERPVVVLAVDGFHAGVDPHSVLYAGMSRARDLLVVVGPEDGIEAAAGAKVLRRLRRR